jgi:hypothetical protein
LFPTTGRNKREHVTFGSARLGSARISPPTKIFIASTQLFILFPDSAARAHAARRCAADPRALNHFNPTGKRRMAQTKKEKKRAKNARARAHAFLEKKNRKKRTEKRTAKMQRSGF